jgi:hypothetical protein
MQYISKTFNVQLAAGANDISVPFPNQQIPVENVALWLSLKVAPQAGTFQWKAQLGGVYTQTPAGVVASSTSGQGTSLAWAAATAPSIVGGSDVAAYVAKDTMIPAKVWTEAGPILPSVIPVNLMLKNTDSKAVVVTVVWVGLCRQVFS